MFRKGQIAIYVVMLCLVYYYVLTLPSLSANEYDPPGIEYFHDGKFEKALQSFNKDVEHNPDDPSAYANRGGVYELLGQHEKALKDINQAIALLQKKSFSDKFESAHAFNNLGVIYMDLGKLDKAIASFKKAILLKENSADPHEQLGTIYAKQGKKEAALEHLNLALQYYKQEGGFKHAEEVAKKIRGLDSISNFTNTLR